MMKQHENNITREKLHAQGKERSLMQIPHTNNNDAIGWDILVTNSFKAIWCLKLTT